MLHLLALLLPLLFGSLPVLPSGPLADRDGDGTRAVNDCDDSDPARWLWYCYDDDKDGTWDADSPMPKVCASVAVPPPDPHYLACGA